MLNFLKMYRDKSKENGLGEIISLEKIINGSGMSNLLIDMLTNCKKIYFVKYICVSHQLVS